MTLPRASTAALVVALLLAAPASADVRLESRDEPVPRASVHARGSLARTLAPRAVPFAFNLVGLHWRGAGDVWFRTAPAGGSWSPWRPARPEAEDRPDAGTPEGRRRAGWKLGNPYWVGSARRIQYRLHGPVAALRAHFLRSPVERAPLARRVVAAPGAPAIVTRADWGADESIVRGSPSYADRLAFSVVHHTAGAKPTSPAQSAAIVRGILSYHVRSNGWNDVGYNFLVDPFGQVFEGRAGGITRNVVGAHAQGFNTGSVGVALLGSYESAEATPTARSAIASLLAWRLDLAHVDPASRLTRVSGGSPKWPAGTPVSLPAVSGHRDVGLTACPGALLYGRLRAIAVEAAALGGPKLFDPRVEGDVGGPVRFTARLSAALPWTVSVANAAGATVAVGHGSGTVIDWTWDASDAPRGRYTYSMDAGPDVRPASGAVGGAVPLEIESLAARPGVITPNGDRDGDTATIAVALSTPATLAVWLEDAAGRRVRTLVEGRASVAGVSRITWRGQDASGRAVPDGRYRLVAEATSGSERDTASTSVTVDRTVGRLAVRPAAFSPNGDGAFDEARISYRLTREANVRLRVFAGSRAVATLVSGRRGAVPAGAEHAWDGRAAGRSVADGRLRVVLEATTSLGTRRLERGLVLDTRPPRIGGLVARRYRRGTLIRFTLSEPAALTVRVGARLFRPKAGAGRVQLWRRVRAGRVAIQATDALANASRPVAARVRGR